MESIEMIIKFHSMNHVYQKDMTERVAANTLV